MKKRIFYLYKSYFLAFIMFFGFNIKAQVLVVPLHQQSEIFFFDHLFQVNLVNTTQQAQEGILEVEVQSSTLEQVLKMTSHPLYLPASGSLQNYEITWSNSMEWGQMQFLSRLVQTSKLPHGEYVFCYRFISNSAGNVLGVNCQEKPIKAFGLPELISPYDKENLSMLRPLLTWKAPLPLISTDVTYDLKLTPLQNDQTPAQAIQINFPLLDLKKMKQTILPYPLDAVPLEKEEDYVWQVTAFYAGIPLGKTEIWQFRISDNPTKKRETEPLIESYRFAKSHVDASYYTATDILRLAYHNRLNDKILAYQVYLVENTSHKIKNLPIIHLKPGTNTLDIELTGLEELDNGKLYILEIKDKIGKKHYFKFKYQGSNEN